MQFVPLLANDTLSLRPPHAELLPSWWEQNGSLLALIVLLLVVWIAYRILRRPPVLPAAGECPAVKARRALEILRQESECPATAGDAARILRHYLAAVLQLPRQERTTEEWTESLRGHGNVPSAVLARVSAFFQSCDRLQFAPVPTPQPLGSIPTVLAIIEQVEAARQPEQNSTAVKGAAAADA